MTKLLTVSDKPEKTPAALPIDKLDTGSLAMPERMEPVSVPVPPAMASTTEKAAASGSEPAPKKSLGFKITVSLLLLVTVVGAMDALIVSACLPAITKDLSGNSGDAFWVGTGFLLAQTITIPVYGTLSDIFGRKWLILSALLIFLFGSILCTAAQSMNWLIWARVVQGLGAGGTLNLVSVIMSDLTTLRERGLYFALNAAAWAVGMNMGIPLGGAIGTYTSWRWIFGINVPLLIFPIIGLPFFLNLTKDTSSFWTKLARIDWFGMAIFSGGSFSLLYGITTGGTVHPWSSAQVISSIVVGLVAYIVFIIFEWRVAREPMVPMRVFKTRSAALAFFQAFIHGLTLWGISFFFVLFFLGALQHDLLLSSAETLSAASYSAPLAALAGILMKKYHRFRIILWFAWFFYVLGIGTMILNRPDSNGGILYGMRVFLNIGAGVLFVTPIAAVQVNQRDEDVGMATSLLIFFRCLGQAFGVAIGGVILQNQWAIEVASRVSSGKIPPSLALDSSTAERAYVIVPQFPPAVQVEYQWVYADTLKMVWIVMTAIAALGLIASLFSGNESLDRGTTSKQGFEERKRISEEADV